MKLSQLKNYLSEGNEVVFHLPDGGSVAPHAHLTELGLIQKTYLDCGGNRRNEHYVTMQLWEAQDTEHRLSPSKFASIIQKTEQHLPLADYPIRVEYQGDTVGIYQLNSDHTGLNLIPTHTDCQAKDDCGTPVKNERHEEEVKAESCCAPGAGCC